MPCFGGQEFNTCDVLVAQRKCSIWTWWYFQHWKLQKSWWAVILLRVSGILALNFQQKRQKGIYGTWKKIEMNKISPMLRVWECEIKNICGKYLRCMAKVAVNLAQPFTLIRKVLLCSTWDCCLKHLSFTPWIWY